jgi:hypothetical protein
MVLIQLRISHPSMRYLISLETHLHNTAVFYVFYVSVKIVSPNLKCFITKYEVAAWNSKKYSSHEMEITRTAGCRFALDQISKVTL